MTYEDIFSDLPVSVMENYHKFRESHYNFLYLCRSCARSFDSKQAVEVCKFCDNSVIELRSLRRMQSGWRQGFRKKVMYRYYCPTCEKNFMTTEHMAFCNRCRTDYLHVYTWDKLRNRDKLFIKFNRSFRNVFTNKASKVGHQGNDDMTSSTTLTIDTKEIHADESSPYNAHNRNKRIRFKLSN